MDELHHDEELAVGAADVVDVADMRMAQPRRVLRFPAQPRLRVFTVEGRHLQRNVAAELCVARGIDVTHAAAADEALDLVVTDDAAAQQRRRGRLLDEISRLALRVEQALDLGAHRVIARARVGDECGGARPAPVRAPH